jgi:hypothetical protein
MPANVCPCLVITGSVVGPNDSRIESDAAFHLIGQIKNQNSRAGSDLSEGVGSSNQSMHLFTMSKDPAEPSRRMNSSKLALKRRCAGELVEPIGIEPTTSCLQSTRSPN